MPSPKAKQQNIVQRRPAETTGLSGAVALLICKAAGIDDPDTLVAIGVVASTSPAAVTWLVLLIRGE